MTLPTRLLPWLLLLVLASSWPAAAQTPDETPAQDAAAAGATASSLASDGVPQFLWATADVASPVGGRPEDVARWHLARFARAFAAHGRE